MTATPVLVRTRRDAIAPPAEPDPATLGAVTAVFRYRRWPRWLAAVALATPTTAVLAVAIVLVWNRGAPMAPTVAGGAAAIGAGLALLIGSICWPGAGAAVELRWGGCRVRTRAGTAVIPWSEVTAMLVEPGGRIAIEPGWPYRRRRTAFHCAIESTRWRLGLGLRHLELVRAVEDAVAPFVWARLREAFARGDELRFGAIVATPRGLRLRGEGHAWTELAGLRVAGGMVVLVRRDGRTATLHAVEISFLPVLEQLVRDRIRDVAAAAARALPAGPHLTPVTPVPGSFAVTDSTAG